MTTLQTASSSSSSIHAATYKNPLRDGSFRHYAPSLSATSTSLMRMSPSTMSATTVQRPQQHQYQQPTTAKLRLSSSASSDSNGVDQPQKDGSQFVVLSDAFLDVLGSRPHLRRLLRSPDGKSLFHEAGVFVRNSNTVVLSSNRMTEADNPDDQYACVVHLPVDCIPAPASDALDDAAQAAIWKRIQVFRPPFPQGHLFMPNGATHWPMTDSSTPDGVLWCEQGKHDLDATDPEQAFVHSALVAYHPESRATKVLLDSFQGRRFSSLNDVVVHPTSGCVFFTDPDYGVEQRFKRCHSMQTYAPNGVYCWQPSTGRVELLDTHYDKPNGCTFVLDPRAPTGSGRGLLLTTDTGRLRFDHECCPYSGKVSAKFVVDGQRPACIYAYPVNYDDGDGTAWPRVATDKRKLVAHSTSGAPDGIHSDDKGNVWAGHGDGVHVYALDWPAATSAATNGLPVGRLIGKVKLPEGRGVANFCWAGEVAATAASGDAKRYRLLIFAEDELWEAVVGVNGRD